MATGMVYVIRNLITGKQFVGSTTMKLSRIWSYHKSWANGSRKSPLYQEMRKFGDKNFIIEPCEEQLSYDQLRNKLKEWVTRLHTHIPLGYNLSSKLSGCRVRFKPHEVRKIIELSKTIPQTHIARKYNVSQTTISRIVARKIYK